MTNLTSIPAGEQNTAVPAKKKKKITFLTVNLIIAGIFLNPIIGLIWLTMLPVFTAKLWKPVLLVSVLALPAFSILNRKTGKCKVPLWIVRIAALVLSVCLIIPPLVYAVVPNKPGTYPLNSLLVTKGICGEPYAEVLLPEKLPEKREHYHFQGGSSTFADGGGRTKTMLYMFTNEETLSAYEKRLTESEYCRSRTMDGLTIEEEKEYYSNWLPYAYMRVPDYENAFFTGHAKYFEGKIKTDNSYSNSGGAVINHDTGLLFIWL